MRQLLKDFHLYLGIYNSQGDINLVPGQAIEFEPVHYRKVADYLKESRGLPSVDVPTPHHSTWLDNSKAKFLLDWRPKIDLKLLIDKAWNYQRSPEDARKIWYPG